MHAAAESTENADFASALEVAKLQALYHFAYGLSHEINNPLANIATRAQTLLADEQDPQRRRKLATIVQQAFKAHEMIADLMLFARPPALRLAEVDLAKLADTVVSEMQERAREQGTALLRTGDASPLLAQVDPTQIAVALKALIQNSLEAVGQGGRIDIEVQRDGRLNIADCRLDAGHSSLQSPHSGAIAASPKSASSNPRSAITVTDTGTGIPPEIREHIFDPFFSGREAGRGLGLGLSKAWRIVDLHGGQITVESDAGRGATFVITLPQN
jgi:signal transduction histidine kinase